MSDCADGRQENTADIMTVQRLEPEIPEPSSEPSGGSGCLVLFKFVLYLGVFLLLMCVAVGIVAFLVYHEVTGPGVPGEDVKVTVPAGASGQDVGELLAQAGLIEHPAFFRVALRLDKSGKPIKQGPYALPRGLAALELLHVLQEGPNRPLDPSEIPEDRKVTVPEGLTVAQAAELFAEPKAFVEAAASPALLERLGLKAKTLEGFLMPNTYYFDRKPTEREVVERMVEQFEKDYAALVQAVPGAAARDKVEVVTIASLVEEEGKVDDERPKIAAVITNRIKKGMPLQMDSTLQYALGKYGQRMLETDKDVDSPYNTYLYAGLPPGPISSPGIAALRAALEPADVDYLYFVSNADGTTHTFSSTSEEHLRAVRKFRREIAPQRKDAKQ